MPPPPPPPLPAPHSPPTFSARGRSISGIDFPVIQPRALSCCFCFRRKPFVQDGKLPETQRPIQVNLFPPESPSSLRAIKSSPPSAVATVYDLPPGWKPVASRSRPDRFAYLNEFTGERISWLPTEPASTNKGEIKRLAKKRKSAPSVPNSESDGAGEAAATERGEDEQVARQGGSSGSENTLAKIDSANLNLPISFT